MPVARAKLLPIVVFTIIAQAMAIALNAALTFVTHRTHGTLQWALVNIVTLVFGIIAALVEASKPEGRRQRADQSPTRAWDPYRRRYYYRSPVRQRGTPLIAALLVVVLLGIGGFAVTQVARYAVGYYSGNESGSDYLVHPKSGTSGALTLTVEHVYYTRHFTRVEIDVQNSGSETVDLPVFGYTVFTGSDGTSFQGDPERSHWVAAVPAGIPHHSGTIVFKGKLAETVTSATFSFTQIFSLSGGALTVTGLELRKPGVSAEARSARASPRFIACRTMPPGVDSRWRSPSTVR